MKEIKKVLICGIGAIGSIYADKIQSYDSLNLRILVNKDRYDKYIKNPVVFNGRELNFNYVLPDETDFKADLIIIATKFDGLNDVIKNLENFVHDDTIILSLLNGVTSEKIIAAKYGREKLLYSCYIGHSAVRTGRNVVHDNVNTIVFGSENSDDYENVQSVREYFEKAKINYKLSEDITRSLWLKFMLNVAANQTTAVLGMTFAEMLENKKCMQFAINVMKEVQLAAKFEGVNNTETMIDETVEHLHTMLPEGKTSMLQDVEAGRKTEVNMFAGTIIDYGKKHNFQTPYNKILKDLLEIIYEKQELENKKSQLIGVL